MNSTKVMLLIAGVMMAFACVGCESSNNTNATAAQTPAGGNTSLTAPATQSPAGTANNNPTANNAVTNTGSSTRVNPDPPTKIGPGGNDFALFTQTRAALDADAALKGSNIIIDIKDGSVKLSGTVANAEQKTKAEQLIRAVNGVKGVQNQLTISAGGAKR